MGLPQTSRSSNLRVLAVVLVLSGFALGATLAGAVLYLKHVVQTSVVNVAKASGVRLTLGEVNWGIGFIQLFDSRFELLKVPGVSGTVRRIDVDLAYVTPTRLLLQNVALRAQGDPVILYRDLSAYAKQLEQLRFKKTSDAETPKFELKELAVHLISTNPFLPNLTVTDLVMARGQGELKNETAFTTATTRLGTLELGPLSLAFRTAHEGGLELGYGKTLADSQWRLGYQETPAGPAFALVLEQTAAKVLFARLGQPVPDALSQATLKGQLTFALDSASGKGGGKLNLALAGFAPPYPAELQGYATSPHTELEATLQSDPLLTTLTIPVLRLNNGDIRLLGNGRIERQALVARIMADLNTTLDCVTLAKGYARSSVGGDLGAWGARNARRAIRGQVSVRVQLDALSNDLANAKVVKRIGVGCGLRPMTLEDLLSLGLPPPPEPKAVERLTQQLISGVPLPTLPSLLPSFREVLDVNLGAMKRP